VSGWSLTIYKEGIAHFVDLQAKAALYQGTINLTSMA
jgi:hypothetical protein